MNAKIFSARVTVFFAFLMLPIEIFSQAPPVTSVGAATLAIGTFTVPINVSGFTNVGNISLTLNYNPDELVYTGATLNSGLNQSTAVITPVTDQSGTVRFSYISNTAIILGSPVNTLFTLTFTAEAGVTGVHSLLTWSHLQGECDMTPPSPGSFSPPISASNISTYFIDGFIDIPGAAKTLNLTLFLEGLFISGSSMNQAQGAAGNQFPGTTADQITIELHSSVAGQYATVVHSAAGINLSTSGTATIVIPSNLAGSYYLTIKHRNSIVTVSALPVSFAGSIISYNFSTSAAMAYGGRLKNVGGVFVIYGGDVNLDGLIDISDMISVDNLSAIASTGYLPSDVNGDGLVDITDLIIVDNNASQAIGAIIPL